MNLDLPKIDEREKFQAYFDLFVTNSFFPQIMYPTRISKVQSHRSARSARKHHTRMSATLIDQMFCRIKYINSAEYSGIVLSAMSDHFPYFSVLDIMKKNVINRNLSKSETMMLPHLLCFKMMWPQPWRAMTLKMTSLWIQILIIPCSKI